MLDQQKIILNKLSYDRELFKKEIIQSFKWLKSYEIVQLHRWLKENYEKTHHDVIKEIFEYIAA